MTDNFDFSINVSIYDQWQLGFDPRGQQLKQECEAAVRRVLERKGYEAYREQYFISISG